jgi:putative hydrolase of the HAD superfamily
MTKRDLGGISVITFDAGGTLFHPYPSVGEIYREVALNYGRDYPATQLEQSFSIAFSIESKKRISLCSEEMERDFWKRVVMTTVNAVGHPPEDLTGYCSELWETFARASRWRVYHGTESTLETLCTRGYSLAIISNWDRRLHSVLSESGLNAHFRAVVISSEVGFAKPAKEIFRFTESALDAWPANCLHVGDSRSHDVEGARRCGWRALRVRHDESPCLDDEIPDLESLLTLLPKASTASVRR